MHILRIRRNVGTDQYFPAERSSFALAVEASLGEKERMGQDFRASTTQPRASEVSGARRMKRFEIVLALLVSAELGISASGGHHIPPGSSL
jgi:hypothetical protein